jgi:formate hydrogenlyase subunit 6/NADH:ubiquinone oxidoreductase subunit I
VAHIRDHKCPAANCSALVSYNIDPDKCTGCTLCAKNCPVDAISGAPKQLHSIDHEKCVKCGQCITSCNFEAVYKAV